MSQTNDTTPEATGPSRKRPGGLNGMLLAELKALASGLGIRGGGSMKKAQLIEAIKAAQGSQGADVPPRAAPPEARTESRREEQSPAARRDEQTPAARGREEQPVEERSPRPAEEEVAETPRVRTVQRTRQRDRSGAGGRARGGDQRDGGPGPSSEEGPREEQGNRDQGNREQASREQASREQASREQGNREQGNREQANREQANREQANREQANRAQSQQSQQAPLGAEDDDASSRRNRRRRGRERDRTGRGREPDTSILEDDVLVPAAGILDVLENYAFVRTSGYLPGPDDVYVSLSMVRKYGLRRGDAVVGQVRQPREGERREKFNPLVRIDSINGADPESAQERPDFAALTPVHPDERLRLETDPANLTGRVIDLVAPVGKGQRGLVVSPPQTGKTMTLRSVAASVTANNPECHLMVVLIDARPEEVTDFQRTIKGEVIASTFDRPAGDHTMLAELAVERAQRLVELGHDVVVLLDSITGLGRAYNLAAPASGRILSGGVDSNALHPPKKLFGAARNVEDGGSLTILATASVETGSKMDEVILEEFRGTENLELRLRAELAEKRLFPAIDPVRSGTRREELLVSAEELAITWKLRRDLRDADPQQALERLLERLRTTQTNIELLTQVQRSAPGAGDR